MLNQQKIFSWHAAIYADDGKYDALNISSGAATTPKQKFCLKQPNYLIIL